MNSTASEFLLAYAVDLLRRSQGAETLPFSPGSSGDWSPIEHQCHTNVEEWCARNPHHSLVRGWLYFSFCGVLPYVRFSAHSVVKLADGSLRDITPSKASMPYPFIPARESSVEYDRWVRGNEIVHLDFYVNERRVIPFGARRESESAG